MDNNANFRIAVYIAGTVERHSGFGQIASVGALAGMEDKSLDVFPISSGITNENPIITLKNTDSYVFYKLWDSSIYISDDNNVGRFCIGMTIPSQARLKDNKSPYTLLMELYHKYLEMGTVLLENGSRKFANVELNKEELFKVLQDYPIIPAAVKVEAMKGTTRGQLRLSHAQMEDFFRDSQYHEFVNYDSVEITTTGDTMFPNLLIPHPKIYQVVLNGKPTDQYLQRGGVEECVVRLEPSADYSYESLKITLNQLLAANGKPLRTQSGKTNIRLDENTQSIVCSLEPVERWYFKSIKKAVGSDDNAYRYFLDNLGSRIKIYVGGHPWEEERIKPSSVVVQHSDGRVEVKKESFTVEPEGSGNYRFSIDTVRIEPDYSNSGKEKITVYVKAIRALATKEKTGGNSNASGSFKNRLLPFLLGLVVGLALGIGGILLLQRCSGKKPNPTPAEPDNSEQVAFDKLTDTLRTPAEANSYRAFLKNYPSSEYAPNVQKGLDDYIKDSTAVRSEYNEVFGAVKAASDDTITGNLVTADDTLACFKYLEKYELPESRPVYFNIEEDLKGVREIREKLLKKLEEQQPKTPKEQAEEEVINTLKGELIKILNEKKTVNYENWLKEKTKVAGQNKLKKVIVAKNVNWCDHILRRPSERVKQSKYDDYVGLKMDTRTWSEKHSSGYKNAIDKYNKGNFSNNKTDWALIEMMASDIEDLKNNKIIDNKYK